MGSVNNGNNTCVIYNNNKQVRKSVVEALIYNTKKQQKKEINIKMFSLNKQLYPCLPDDPLPDYPLPDDPLPDDPLPSKIRHKSVPVLKGSIIGVYDYKW